MVKIVRSLLVFFVLAATLHAAESETPAEHTLKGLVVREHELFDQAEKNRNSPDFDQDDFKSQLQQLADAYEALLHANPDFTAAHVAYGQMLWKIDMRKEAVAHLLKADEIEKDIPLVKNLLGDYLAEEGRPIEALPYFLAAVRLAPKEPLYHYNLGRLLYEARDDFIKSGGWTRPALDHAMLEAFRNATALAPDRLDFASRYAAAFSDLETPDWDGALAAWRALEPRVKPGFDLQLVRLQEATVLLKQNKPDDARALLDAVTEPKLAEQKEKLAAQLPPRAEK